MRHLLGNTRLFFQSTTFCTQSVHRSVATRASGCTLLLLCVFTQSMLLLPKQVVALPLQAQTFYQQLPAYEKARWKALINAEPNQKITDKSFILSGSDFSAEDEWLASYAHLQNNPGAICRFPARYRFMQTYTDLPVRNPLNICPEYRKFVENVPFDQLKLVYASADVSSPVTMMGHVMLATEGINNKGRLTRNSISFSVDLEQIKLLKDGWRTLVSGKEGYLAITPLKEHFDFYQNTEQRDVWSFTLILPERNLPLIRDHIWELKQTRLDYLFHSYNCATLIANILKISQPELDVSYWTSPLDVVQAAEKNQLISQSELRAASRWQHHQISDDDFPYPAKQNRDSQINIGFTISKRLGDVATLEWLPTSHTLEDYQLSRFSDSELKIAGITLEHQLVNNRTELQQLDFYSVVKLTPNKGLYDELSGRLQLGYKPFYDAKLTRQKTGYIEAGVGKTYPLTESLYLFGLINAGYRPLNDADGLYVRPEAGAYLYSSPFSTGKLKTRLTTSALRLKQDQWQQDYQFTQTFSFSGQALVLSYRHLTHDKDSENITQLVWKHYL